MGVEDLLSGDCATVGVMNPQLAQSAQPRNLRATVVHEPTYQWRITPPIYIAASGSGPGLWVGALWYMGKTKDGAFVRTNREIRASNQLDFWAIAYETIVQEFECTTALYEYLKQETQRAGRATRNGISPAELIDLSFADSTDIDSIDY